MPSPVRAALAAGLLGSLVLAGCGRDKAPGAAGPTGPTTGPAALPTAGVAAATAPASTAPGKGAVEAARPGGGDLPHPEPGLYRSSVRLLALTAPGLPPEVVARMKEGMAQRSGGGTACVTPADAARGYEDRIRKLAGRPDCRLVRYSTAGGRLDAALSCAGREGAEAVLTMKGTMTPRSSTVEMSVRQSGPQVPGGLTMTMQVRSERIGDCP